MTVSDDATAYLAFDLGASSGRAVLGVLRDGRMELRELIRFATPLVERDGHLYWDTEALWAEIRRGLQVALREAPSIRSVSIDSWAVDYVPLDEAGRALRDPYSYRDPRTRGRLAHALARTPAEELYGRTGIQLLEINTLYQLLADLDEEPEMVRRTAHRLPIADYLLYRLSGRLAVERTMASTTQLLDVHTGQWDTELMRCYGIADQTWPPVVPAGTLLGRVDAASWPGTLAPLVVATCSHDTAAAVAAVPVESAGPAWAYLSSGTWSLLGVELGEPILTDSAREANFTNEAGLHDTFRFLKNLTGLWVLQECEREWRAMGEVIDEEILLAEAAAAARPSRLIDLNEPRLAERGDMPAKLLALCEQREIPPPESRGELVRLILESLAAGYEEALRELERITGLEIGVLHIVGGGSRNSLLSQLTANACGCRVLAGPAEATAFGNLLVQAHALGDLATEDSIRQVVRNSFEPTEYLPVGKGGQLPVTSCQ